MRALSRTLAALLAAVALVCAAGAPARAAAEGAGIDPGARGSIAVRAAAGAEGHSVRRLADVDLADPAGWAALAGLTADRALAERPLGDPVPATVDAAGDVVFADLPVGAYVVSRRGAEPVLVTIPFADAGGWTYRVVLHAKPAPPVVKTVDDAGAHVVGDVVSWTVTAEPSVLAAGRPLASFALTDRLDARLEYVGSHVAMGDDALPEDAWDIAVDGQQLALELTAAGRERAQTAGALTWVIDTRVRAIGDGEIPNEAQAYVNETGHRVTPTTRTPPAVTRWGLLRVVKVDNADHARTLAGAEFQIYALDDDGARRGGPLRNGEGGSAFRTDAAGAFGVALRAGRYEVVEAVAPAGYLRDAAPVSVEIAADGPGSLVTHVIGDSRGTALALTGTEGIPWLVGGALALVGAGLLLHGRRRRPRRPRGDDPAPRPPERADLSDHRPGAGAAPSHPERSKGES